MEPEGDMISFTFLPAPLAAVKRKRAPEMARRETGAQWEAAAHRLGLGSGAWGHRGESCRGARDYSRKQQSQMRTIHEVLWREPRQGSVHNSGPFRITLGWTQVEKAEGK